MANLKISPRLFGSNNQNRNNYYSFHKKKLITLNFLILIKGVWPLPLECCNSRADCWKLLIDADKWFSVYFSPSFWFFDDFKTTEAPANKLH